MNRQYSMDFLMASGLSSSILFTTMLGYCCGVLEYIEYWVITMAMLPFHLALLICLPKCDLPIYCKELKQAKLLAKKAFKILGLRPISILMFKNWDNAEYDPNTNEIRIGIDLLDTNFIHKDINPYIKRPVPFSRSLDFVLFHEIGHYYQRVKHPKWMNKRDEIRKQYRAVKYNMSREEYRKLSEERIADRIALILLDKISENKT